MSSGHRIYAPKEWFSASASPPGKAVVRVDRWLRKEGSGVKAEDVIAEASVIIVAPNSNSSAAASDLTDASPKTTSRLLLRAGRAGILSRILIPTGQEAVVEIDGASGVPNALALAEVRDCDHPMLFGGMCVACGATKQQLQQGGGGGGGARVSDSYKATSASDAVAATARSNSSIDASIVSSKKSPKSSSILVGQHSIELSEEEALRRKGLLARGLQQVRKLALILDLDNTLVHACPAPYLDEGEPTGMEDNMHYIRFTEQVLAPGGGKTKFTDKQAHYIKLRDSLTEFLAEASKEYQLSVYTHGTRAYAEAVVSKLDPDRTLFSNRIVSRSDTNYNNIKSLENLFLDDWSMVLVMDDREDVWLDAGKQQHMHLLKVIGFYHKAFAPSRHQVSPLQPPVAAPAADAITVSPSDKSDGNKADIESKVPVLGDASNVATDQAMSKKDDACSPDMQLPRCLEILHDVHQQYYDQLGHGSNDKPSTAAILAAMKSKVLAGCCITFSGEFDVSMSDERKAQQPRWRFAVALGAVVQLNITPFTTHVVVGHHVSGRSTSKATMAETMGSIYVVQWTWLGMCYCHIKRVDETPYLLCRAPTRAPRDITELPAWQREQDELERMSRKRKELDTTRESGEPRKSSRVLDDFGNYVDIDENSDATHEEEEHSGDHKSDGDGDSDSGGSEGWLEDMEDDLNAALTGGLDEA